jgi:hypothetical protein
MEQSQLYKSRHGSGSLGKKRTEDRRALVLSGAAPEAETDNTAAVIDRSVLLIGGSVLLIGGSVLRLSPGSWDMGRWSLAGGG